MKNIVLIFCTAFLFSTPSYATGFFIGGDILFANAQYEAKNNSSILGPKNGDIKDADNLNYGINAGLRVDLLSLLVSGEVFYDNLEVSAQNFESTTNQIHASDDIELKNRYGVKANIGMAILPRITPFLTFGMSKVSYGSNVYSSGHTLSKSELSPLYGVGILVDLPLNISVKASYDYQSLNMNYAESGSKIRSHLGVAKLGMIYNF